MKKVLLLGLCAALLFTAACGGDWNTVTSQGACGACFPQAKAVNQVAAPVYPKGDEAQLEPIEGYEEMLNGLYAFSTRSASALLGKGQANAAYSPVSLYLALTLSASGAAGNTLDEMYTTLGLSGRSKDEVAQFVNTLYRELYGEEEYGHLYLFNSLWLSTENSFKQSFLQGAKRHYFAEVFTVDPAQQGGDPISDWVARKTGGKLLRESVPVGDIVMNLVSVIDFYGEWTSQFNKERNTKGVFTLPDGTTVQAEYMNSGSSGGFYRGNGWTLASRSLKNGARMSFILPDEGMDINDLLADEVNVAAMLYPGDAEGVENFYGEIVWSVPKFDFQSSFRLVDMLKSLGMQSAFTFDADFSETSGLKPLFISDARQASRVTVNENGVSASAYTELFYTGAGLPQDRAEMILNRPFAFVIDYNGVPLFVGVVNNPS